MESKRYSNVISFFLLLMFCVAVSGGCGGSSGGHYSGNFGQDENSSQDVTPAPESQDVIPENPVSDDQNGDDYGVNNGNDTLRKFKLLNNSVWKIDNVEVYGNGAKSRSEGCAIIPNTFSYNTETITLATNNDLLTWYDGNGDYHIDPDDYLTVNVKDPDDGTQQTITILRIVDGFKVQPGFETMYNSSFVTYIPRNDGTNTNDDEIITCQALVGSFRVSDVASSLKITCSCKGSNNQEYFSFLYLSRLDLENWESNGNSVYSELFEKLNDTEWTIKSVDVVGPNGKSRTIKKNTYNYDVSKITLFMAARNNNGDLSGSFTWFDGNGNPPAVNKPLTVNFSDGIFTTRTATLLTPATGFKYKGSDANDTLEYQTTFSDGNTETIFQHNWKENRQDNPFVRISNSFTINNQQYTANMLLVPAK